MQGQKMHTGTRTILFNDVNHQTTTPRGKMFPKVAFEFLSVCDSMKLSTIGTRLKTFHETSHGYKF